MKPFSYQEFLNAAQKAKDWFEQIHSAQKIENQPQFANENSFFFVKSEYKQIKILFEDILYIEGLKDYVKIYLQSEERPILTLLSLKKLEDELPNGKFMRVHRSFIVALDKIERIERNQIIIRDQRITVSEQNRDDFRKFMDNKLM